MHLLPRQVTGLNNWPLNEPRAHGHQNTDKPTSLEAQTHVLKIARCNKASFIILELWITEQKRDTKFHVMKASAYDHEKG